MNATPTPRPNIGRVGRQLATQRGARGIRDTAKEIGISPATLSRVERGLMPDLETFGKICRWLRIDPAEILGITEIASTRPAAVVHFRKDHAIEPATAKALAEMILAAQRAFMVADAETSQ